MSAQSGRYTVSVISDTNQKFRIAQIFVLFNLVYRKSIIRNIAWRVQVIKIKQFFNIKYIYIYMGPGLT
jgi:hypothetical protein